MKNLKKMKLTDLVQLPALSKSELEQINGGYAISCSCSCSGSSCSGSGS